MARLPPPVTMITCSIPLAIASSTPYWIVGLSTRGSISFGCAFVTGRKHGRGDGQAHRREGQQALLRRPVRAGGEGHRNRNAQARHRAGEFLAMSTDDLDRVSPRESAHVKARDRKVRGPKVVSVNPGLKKLALHLADKRKRKKK